MQALGEVGLLCRHLEGLDLVRLDFCAGTWCGWTFVQALGEVRLLCRRLVRLDFCAGAW